MRCVNANKHAIIEGEIRAKELADYLIQMKCTKVVWISEDATAISAKVTYDQSTNQLIGLTLPLDKSSGCPKSFVFSATDAETIKSHLLQERSNALYLIMAQPLDEKIPPFALQMFGTANSFDTQDVIKRWKTTEIMLARYELMNLYISLLKMKTKSSIHEMPFNMCEICIFKH